MKQLPKTKNCKLELENDWLTIWFNNPEKRNALSEELLTGVNAKKNTNIEKIYQIKNTRRKMSVFLADISLLGVEQKIPVEDPPEIK